MSANVLGLDLSLTSTGFATLGMTGAFKPGKALRGVDRIRAIVTHVLAECQRVSPELVAIEGPSYGSVGSGQHERGGLWWCVVDAVDMDGNPIVVVPPAVVKKYATGKGNAGKDEMILAAARRWEGFDGGNDEADAWFLAHIAADLLGAPAVKVPASHRAGLASKVTWIREVAA